MIPSRPWRTVHGSVDSIVLADPLIPRIRNEMSGGASVRVRGWISNNREPFAVVRAWIVLERANWTPSEPESSVNSIAVETGVHRQDVSSGYGSAYQQSGVDMTICVPFLSGDYTARIVAQTAAGEAIVGRSACPVRIAAAPLQSAPAHLAEPANNGATLRIGDTVGFYTHDRGTHSVRQEASLRIHGETAGVSDQALLRLRGRGHDRWYALSLRPLGFAAADAPGAAAFDQFLSITGLPRGAYEALLYLGSTPRPACALLFEITGDHDNLPGGLARFYQSFSGPGWHTFENAAALPAGASRAVTSGIRRGDPLFVAGSIIDTTAHGEMLALFAQVDDRHPIPLPSWSEDNKQFGFGGIIDTTRLGSGSHDASLLAISSTGNGYHLLGPRSFRIRQSH